MTDQVWLAHREDSDGLGSVVAAVSPEAAERCIKAMYPPPSVVEWDPLRPDEDGFRLIGHFDAVPHYSTEHVAIYDISPYPLVTGRELAQEDEL